MGTTGLNPAFISRNLLRDQMTAFINSDKAMRTSIASPRNWLKGFTSSLGQDDLYQEFVRNAGGGTSFDISRNPAKQTVESIASFADKKSRIKYLVKNPSELFRAVEDVIGQVSETPTRMQQYIGIKNDLIKKGMPAVEAEIAASRAARETTANFARRGEWGQVLNSSIPYLNAGIQGSRATIKAMAKDPKGTSIKIAATVLLPETINTLWALSDPTRKEAWADIQEYEKENNFIIIPPNPTKDENGKWNVIKIPKPPGIGNLATLVRRPLEDMADLDPVKFKEMFDAAIGSVSPVQPNINSIVSTVLPQAIKPTAQSLANYDFFTGMPVVSSKYEKLSPEKQVKPGTTFTSQKIGETLKVSPIKTDAFIRSTFGQAGFNVVNAIDNILAGTGVIPKEKVGGQSFVKAITESFTKARGEKTDSPITDKAKKVITTMNDERFALKQEAEIVYNELKALPKDQANLKIQELDKVNPRLVDKIYDVADEEKKGLTYDDRLIKQMGVEDGTRAKFIYELSKEMSKDKANAYISDLDKKGIISDEVYNQLVELIKKNSSSKN
jgi:hypothetical protein